MLLKSHLDRVVEVERSLGVVGLGLEVHDKIVLDGKDRVNTKVGVVAGVDLVDDGGVVGVGDHKVDVSGTHGRAVHNIEEHTGGAVGGQRVRGRVVAVPVELALLVGPELATQVVFALVGVLEVVLAVGGGLPNVEDSTLDRRAGLHVSEHTMHESDLSVGVRVLDNAVAEGAEGSIGRPEGTENDVGGRSDTLIGDNLVGDLVDERFKTNHVANTVAFVTDGSADFADGVDELDTEHPLGGSEFDLTSKVVDVLDQRTQDDASALRDLRSHGVDDIGSEVGVKLAVGGHFVCSKCMCVGYAIWVCRRCEIEKTG